MKLSEKNDVVEERRQNIPALKEIIDERKEKAVETLSISYSKNRLPLEEYERLVEYINKIESERELIVVEKIVAEYSIDSSDSNKTDQSAYNDYDEAYYPERGYRNSRENLTVLSSRTYQGPVSSGSQFVSILGTEQIIIRKADLRKGQNVLNIVSILGDSSVLVEQGIRVINRAIPVLGNCETRFKDFKNAVDNDKELIISGAAILGNITIKPLKN